VERLYSQGDRFPALAEVMLDASGVPVDLSLATVGFDLFPLAGGPAKVSGVAEAVAPGGQGLVKYPAGSTPWAAGDLDTPGLYLAQFTATWADGRRRSWPLGGAGERLVVRVTARPVVAPTELLTVDVLADALGLSPGLPGLARAALAASEAVVGYVRRPLVYQAARTEKHAGAGQLRLALQLTPVVSVASVTDAGGTAVDPASYVLEDEALGWLYREAGWPFTGMVRAGIMQDEPYSGSERRALTVTYAGGYVTPAQAQSPGWTGPARSLPRDLEEAVLRTAASIYQSGGRDGTVATEALGSYSVSYRNRNVVVDVGAGGLIPDEVLPTLQRYRRLSL
jgi:hypothetical protein